jgi:formylglycine-generating enzyme required for sulfatase activity
MQAIVAGEVCVELIAVPAGTFLMGSANEFFSEAPAHPVSFRSGFLMGKYPITQAQWQAVMGHNPSAFRDAPDRPVDSVTWEQAAAFCRCLSERTGRRVRLPSEAEWEYACRAGTADDFFFGPWGPLADDGDVPWEARQALCEYAWFDLNSGGGSRPVGLKRPNPWGLHDLLGNVWEWCADVWHGDYAGAPGDGSPWVEGAGRQPRRCLRGGAWDMNAFRCRSPYRSYDDRELATNRFGFRVVVDANPTLHLTEAVVPGARPAGTRPPID